MTEQREGHDQGGYPTRDGATGGLTGQEVIR
jgi:hypothetical protein